MKSRNINILSYILVVCFATMLAACSTTKKIPDGEYLYNGVKDLNIGSPIGVKPTSALNEQISTAINVRPNNCLISPKYRTPFPIGLWVYNHWSDSCKGLKGWLYAKLVEKPVLISDVKPDLRTEMIKRILQDNGYFDSSASFDLLQDKKNPKKAKLTYNVTVLEPYTLSTIETVTDSTPISKEIAELVKKQPYLKAGNQYSVDSLNAVRVNITNELRNNGYFYFAPEYIEYLADSTLTGPKQIALRVFTTSALSEKAARKYRTGAITTTVTKNVVRSGATFDTIVLPKNRGVLLKQQNARIKPSLIRENIRFKQGSTFSVKNMDQTQNYLARTGIFSSINIDVTPIDSIKGDQDSVNVAIAAKLDQPLEAKLEVQLNSKSNSYIGPALVASLTQKNLFGGGEQLTIDLSGAYEFQTGSGNSAPRSEFNSYEFALAASLAFPRLLAPKFIDRSRRYVHWTTTSLSGSIYNRPKYFRMAQFSAGFTWQWHANKNSLNEFTPFKLSYTKMLHTTAAFDSAMAVNPSIALSLRDQFIPQMTYAYTFDKNINSKNSITWKFSVTEAGNIFAGLWRMCGVKGEKKMFGTPFSQFVKGQTQLVYRHRFGARSWLVSRVMTGIAHAYGNSTQVPYHEQFYVGGANSIRAFTVRSIGPGRYHNPATAKDGFYDQTGTFKFELNLEYRFPIYRNFHGAIFADAGNVWLLKDNEYLPGGTLKASEFLNDLALGTGIGLRFDMQMLVIRADLGVGIHAPYQTSKPGYYNIEKFKDGLALHIAIGYPF